jgi:hypothetical protein
MATTQEEAAIQGGRDSRREMRECITACQQCASICLATVPHCLTRGGAHAAADHIRTLLDCADICTTSAAFMSRGSSLHVRTCELCADICDECAESCDGIAAADDAMQACLAACKRCAQTCRDMAHEH